MLADHHREGMLEDARLMPNTTNFTDRPRRFANKKVVFVSARVHPGETPSSFVVEGLLQLLLREHDARSIALRRHFVFKVIPMLNPDGVACGCYRADPGSATDLNRMYDAPTFEEHPSILGALAVVRQLHASGALLLYVDVHAHAGKRGCFLYGNRPRADGQDGGDGRDGGGGGRDGSGKDSGLDVPLYAHLASLNSRHIDAEQCVLYGGEPTHAGSAREAVFALTALPHVYTLECNYNSGHSVNELPPRHLGDGVDARCLSPPPPPAKPSQRPKYTPDVWREVGRGIALAALDLIGANPASRIGPLGGNGRPLDALCALRLTPAYLGVWARKHTVTTSAADAEDADDSEGDADVVLEPTAPTDSRAPAHAPAAATAPAVTPSAEGVSVASSSELRASRRAQRSQAALRADGRPRAARLAQQKLIDRLN